MGYFNFMKFMPAAAIIEKVEVKPKSYAEYMNQKDIRDFTETE